MKKITLIIAALSGFFYSQNLKATCSNYTTYSDGQVLSASSLNSLQSNYTSCVNDILNGDTFTGNMNWYSGSDILMFSDVGTTKTIEILGDTGATSLGLRSVGIPINITLVNATTTDANDSIKIQCGNSSCSATNPGFITLRSPTLGQITLFKITSDITIKISGAYWDFDNVGNVTDVLLRVFAVNDNGSLRWCVGVVGGFDKVTTIFNTSATQSNIDNSYELLCDTAVGSSSNTVSEIGFARGNWTLATNKWALQIGTDDIVTGRTADGLVQPYPIVFSSGFSANPTTTSSMVMTGNLINWVYSTSSNGTSNATTIQGSEAYQPSFTFNGSAAPVVDNGTTQTSPGYVTISTTSFSVLKTLASGTWTNSGSKSFNLNLSYILTTP